MKPLVDYFARALVDDPDPVEVEEVIEGEDAIYKLKVGEGDLGKVIGKKGRTAKALRTVLAAAGAKQSLRVSLEIVEPEDGGRRRGRGRGRPDAPASDDAPSTDDVAAPEKANSESQAEKASRDPSLEKPSSEKPSSDKADASATDSSATDSSATDSSDG